MDIFEYLLYICIDKVETKHKIPSSKFFGGGDFGV